MNRTTSLASSIAMALTVGYGASFLVGDESAASPSVAALDSIETTFVAAGEEGVWTHPAVTAVVKVPAKRKVTTALASLTESGNEPSVAEAGTETWMHPAITVVVKVPARTDGTLAMARPTSPPARRGPARPWRVDDMTPGMPAGRFFRDLRRPDGRELGQPRREWNRRPDAPVAAPGETAPADRSRIGTEGASWETVGGRAFIDA